LSQILCDVFPIKLELVESTGSGKVIARGEFGRCDVATANRRRYPRSIIESNIKRLGESIGRRRLLGECDHPSDGKTLLQRASHVITKLEIDKNGVVIGEAELLDTPHGKAIQAILKAGCEIGVSSRGMGSVVPTQDGNEDVQDDYILKTYDFVADPATRSAYPKFVQEALEEAEQAMLEPMKFGNLPDEIRASLLEEAAVEVKQTALEEARVKVQEELTNAKRNFAETLVETISGLKQQVLKEAKDQLLSDPAVGASRAMLESIANIVRPLFTPVEEAERSKENADTLVAMRDAIQSKDLEIANLKLEMSELTDRQARVEIRHQLESQIAHHPKAQQIKKMVGPLDRIESVEDLNGRLEAIFEAVGSTQSIAGQAGAEFSGKLNRLESTNAALEEQIGKLEEKIATLQEAVADKSKKLLQAVRLGEKLDVAAYSAKKAVGRPDALRIMKLAEDCQSREEVDSLLDRHPASALGESEETQRIRSRVRRSVAVDLDEETRSPRVEADPVSSWLKLDAGEFEALSGIGGKT
jgi:hypothetical protein